MKRDVLARTALRGVAIAIAVAAIIDPSVDTDRMTKPVIVVVASDSARHRATADRVVRELEKDFTVSRAPFAGASGTVVVGEQVPRAGSLATPAFLVVPEQRGAIVSIDRVSAPRDASADARVPVFATVRGRGARGRTVDVTLRAGDVVVDRVSRVLDTDEAESIVRLVHVPTSPGIVPLRVVASIGEDSSLADVAVDVREQRWAVLFYDPRPSWMSTFVRRAIERDPRFVVTSRVSTSRDVSTDAGRPPGRLDDLVSLSLFDAVVVGAPEALTAADIGGLEAFMRRRGGGVAVLLDQATPGPHDRLLGISGWRTSASNRVMTFAGPDGDSTALRATELAWPASLPPASELIARGAQPVMWRAPIGAGLVLVSGALDSWRFRDRAASGFDRFWQNAVADLASSTPPPLSIELSNAIVSPGEPIDVRAIIRDAALQTMTNVAFTRPVRVSIAARIDSGPAVRMWPSGGVGRFVGRVRAPSQPGVYRLSVDADAGRAGVSFVVARDVRRATPNASAHVLAAWTAARGGAIIPESRIDELAPSIARAIQPRPQRETWYPMRTAWWIVPFALALSAEWWMRRRRGLK